MERVFEGKNEMIEVIYRGGFGNQLFQYCFGRILATELGWQLEAAPIEGFPATYEAVRGKKIESGTTRTFSDQELWRDIICDAKEEKITLHGFFQKYENFHPYKSIIREHWLKPKLPDGVFSFRAGDLALHVRRGDYVSMGMALPFSFYRDAIEQMQPNRLIIFTDDPGDLFHQSFSPYSPIVFEGNAWQSFCSLMQAPKIVISQSSYSWWASFLGEAERIIAPIPYFGYWADPYFDIDLRVDDEARYQYLTCEPNIAEAAMLQWYRLREWYIRFRRGGKS